MLSWRKVDENVKRSILTIDTNVKDYDTINCKRKLYKNLIILKFIYCEGLPW